MDFVKLTQLLYHFVSKRNIHKGLQPINNLNMYTVLRVIREKKKKEKKKSKLKIRKFSLQLVFKSHIPFFKSLLRVHLNLKFRKKPHFTQVRKVTKVPIKTQRFLERDKKGHKDIRRT